ncbi:hypothetical protein BASA81_001880 [Batrachochytrium salamandrivorans]|nr:hypothetical protein BASA81_001880 [Batrachochytrium salamandrivorans]
MEIVTLEWQHADDRNKIMVRHPSKLGCKSKAFPPQAPAIQILARNLPPNKIWAVLAQCWNFSPSCGYTAGHFTQAKMEHCLAKFEPETNTRDYRMAVLRCSFKKGAGIACRENHIALRLELVELGDLAGTQVRLAMLPQFPPVRTCRIDVSEKKMRALRVATPPQQQPLPSARVARPAMISPPFFPHQPDENCNPTIVQIPDKRQRLTPPQQEQHQQQDEEEEGSLAQPPVLPFFHRQPPTLVAGETTVVVATPVAIHRDPHYVPSTVAQLNHHHHHATTGIDSHLNDCNVQWDAILEDLVLAGPPSSPFKWSTPPRPASAASNHHHLYLLHEDFEIVQTAN